MTSAYDKDLRKLTIDTARELGMSDFVREGVYIHVAGPSYETPAESRFLRMIGADSVGMSTAPEVVVARHCGIRVLGKQRRGRERGRASALMIHLGAHPHRSLPHHQHGDHVFRLASAGTLTQGGHGHCQPQSRGHAGTSEDCHW